MSSHRRFVWAVGPLTMVTLSGCALYGATFGYPSAPPVPDGATVIARDKGSDDDDPIRSQVQVVDAHGTSITELMEFYREAYPESDGWKPRKVGRRQELCLVNRTNDDYVQVLDVSLYGGSRVASRADLHLVVLSRIEGPLRNPCGFAAAWIPMDLLP